MECTSPDDEFSYAIKVYEAFTSLLEDVSHYENKEPQKNIDKFFEILIASVQRPADQHELRSFEYSVKRLRQSLRLCSAELQLGRSSLSINRFLMTIENKMEEITKEKDKLPWKFEFTPSPDQSCSPPCSSIPQAMVDTLLGRLVPQANAGHMKRTFLSLALNVVRERMEKLTTRERSEWTGELINMFSFVHEAEDHEFAPTASLEARLSKLEKSSSSENPQMLQSLRAKISSFLNGKIEVPINCCVTELADYVVEQEQHLQDELNQLENASEEMQPDTDEENLCLDLSPIQTGFTSDADAINTKLLSRLKPAIQQVKPLTWDKMEWKNDLAQKYYTTKMRKVRGKIQVLFSQVLSRRNSAKLIKVALLAGPLFCPNPPPGKIFIYKKINELRFLGQKIAEYTAALFSARSSRKTWKEISRNEDCLSYFQEKYEKELKDLANEVKISREVPDAVRMWIVRKLKDPTQPKGFLMEYIDKISLDTIRNMAPPDSMQQLKIHTEIALLLCQAVERMHKAGYVHLALSPEHFLIEKKQESFAVKLINFKMSVPEGTLGSKRSGDFLKPPEIDTFKGDELFIAHAAIDNWALSFILIEIFYGYKIAREFEGILYKVLHPKEGQLSRYQEILGGIYSQFDPDLTPWENTTTLVKHFLGKYPEADDVILHLLNPDPESRWTAEHAANRFQEILLSLHQ